MRNEPLKIRLRFLFEPFYFRDLFTKTHATIIVIMWKQDIENCLHDYRVWISVVRGYII